MKKIIISFIAFFLLFCIPMAMQSKRNTPILLDDDNTATGIHGYVEDSSIFGKITAIEPLKISRSISDRVDCPPIRLLCFGIISVSVRQFSPVSFLP